VLVLTLLGTPLIAFAQSASIVAGSAGLAAKLAAGTSAGTSAGSATWTAASASPARHRGLRPRKTGGGVVSSRGSNPAGSGQVIASLRQALRAVDATAKGKYAHVSSAQRRQLATLKAAQKDNSVFGVRFNPTAGTPTMIKLSIPKVSTGLMAGSLSDGAAAARSFMRENKALLGMTAPDTDMALKRQWKGPLGSRHFRYQQQMAGIPVWGQEALVHVDGSDAVYLYQGHTVKSTARTKGQTVQITAAEARLAAITHHGEGAVASADNPDRLIYYPENGDSLILSYQVGVEAGLGDRWWYFIDAANSEVVHRISRVADTVVSASGSSLLGVTRSFNAWSEEGDYYLVDPTIPLDDPPYDPVTALKSTGNLYVLDAQNGESDLYYITSTSPTSGWDPAGVSVIYNIGLVYDYYKTTHNRDGIDGANLSYKAVVHLKENFAPSWCSATGTVRPSATWPPAWISPPTRSSTG
jgi:Zn-dependent metalloprotease